MLETSQIAPNTSNVGRLHNCFMPLNYSDIDLTIDDEKRKNSQDDFDRTLLSLDIMN